MDRSSMGFILTEEQKQLKTLVRDFCKREVDQKLMWELVEKAGRAKTIEELRAIQPWDLIKKMHAVGLRQLAVPKEYGGGGFNIGHNLREHSALVYYVKSVLVFDSKWIAGNVIQHTRRCHFQLDSSLSLVADSFANTGERRYRIEHPPATGCQRGVQSLINLLLYGIYLFYIYIR